MPLPTAPYMSSRSSSAGLSIRHSAARQESAGTAARYCNGKGVPTVNPEIGGVYLGPQTESAYLAETVAGLQSVMAALEMIPGTGGCAKKETTSLQRQKPV